MKTVDFGYDFADGDVLSGVFVERALARALRFAASTGWRSELLTLDHVTRLVEGEMAIDFVDDGYERVILELRHAVASIRLDRHHGTSPFVSVTVYAASRQAAKLEIARLKELLPPADTPADDRISVAFWYRTQRGVGKIWRSLEAAGWSETRPNYPARTRRFLEPLVTDAVEVVAGGRLILMHGPPGTGKTSAVRTIARQNRGKLTVEYVLDPESLFGRDAGYFTSVVFNSSDDGDEDDSDVSPTRLLVLEDCDELLSADAKDRSGQGLARLLNLVDGLIGQGMNTAVLITTNEPVGAFHAAVTRPGRCGAVIPFGLFEPDEAAAWLRAHGREPGDVAGRMSLAQLFAFGKEAARPPVPTPKREPIGFATALRR